MDTFDLVFGARGLSLSNETEWKQLGYCRFFFMEEFGLARFDGIHGAVRKKRSQTSRRPKPDAQPVIDSCGHSPSSTTPPSDDVSKASSDENVDTNSRRKEFNLNQCMSRDSSTTEAEGEKSHIRNKEGRGLNAFYRSDTGRSAFNNKRSSEGILAPANWKNTTKVKESFDSETKIANMYSGRNGESQSSEQSGVVLDALVNDNKVKKVKLKVCGVTRTIHANSTNDGASSIKNSRHSETSRSQQKQNAQVIFFSLAHWILDGMIYVKDGCFVA